jgi:hypothetical protein
LPFYTILLNDLFWNYQGLSFVYKFIISRLPPKIKKGSSAEDALFVVFPLVPGIPFYQLILRNQNATGNPAPNEPAPTKTVFLNQIHLIGGNEPASGSAFQPHPPDYNTLSLLFSIVNINYCYSLPKDPPLSVLKLKGGIIIQGGLSGERR